MRVMGKGLVPAAERLVDRVNRLVRAGMDNLSERDTSIAPPRTREEALFLVRDRLGKLIVERRQLQRHIASLPDVSTELSSKAEVAVRHGREDLARAALSEASRLASGRDALMFDLANLDADIALLEQAISQISVDQTPTTDLPMRALLAELDRLAAKAAHPDNGA